MTTRTLLTLLGATLIIGGCSQKQSLGHTTATDVQVAVSTQTARPTGHKHEFKGTREEALNFMRLNREITLTPAQEVVRLEALDQKDGNGNLISEL